LALLSWMMIRVRFPLLVRLSFLWWH